MGRLRRFEHRDRHPGPWVVLNPSPAVSGVIVDNMVFNGDFGDEFVVVFFRAPVRSTFLQRLALARHLTYDRSDKRLVWLREHQMRTGVEVVDVHVEVSVPVGVDQALFVAVVGDRIAPFDLELNGLYFK